MMQIKNHQSRQRKFLIFTVVIVGLLIEWANATVIFNNTNYSQFYIISALSRLPLLIYTVFIIYKIKGSYLLWFFMLFNLSAICMNLLYLDVTMYHLVNEFRRGIYSNSYRILEIMILLWTGRSAFNQIRHFYNVMLHRASFMVVRWRLRNQRENT